MHLLHESEFDSGHFMTRLTNHEMGIMTDLTGVWSSPVMCQMCHLRVCLTGGKVICTGGLVNRTIIILLS